MTAPDSRDSVERVVAEMREQAEAAAEDVTRIGKPALEVERVLNHYIDRLQALARGPQQAGGEDVEASIRSEIYMHFDGAGQVITGKETIVRCVAVLIEDRVAALQAEVARLRERTLEMERQRDDTTKAKQAAEARLAEVWTDARTLAASVHGAFGALGSDPPEPILKLANRYFLMKRRGRRSAALNGGQDDA